jgi:hypothetical protein
LIHRKALRRNEIGERTLPKIHCRDRRRASGPRPLLAYCDGIGGAVAPTMAVVIRMCRRNSPFPVMR